MIITARQPEEQPCWSEPWTRFPARTGSGSLRPDRGKELADHNARLRREHDQLADQLEAALGHLRRLTIDNARLRRELEAARGITRIDPGRAPSQQT